MTDRHFTVSENLFERARQSIPGGVNSPVRAFRAVGRSPLFIDQAAGSNLADADGNTFTDYVGSWGPMILGHAHPVVTEAITRAASRGTSFGAPTEAEIELAEEVKAAFPSIDLVRMVSSGTEATMSAIRLARGFTGRDRIVKFEGCYHGHTDALLVKAGSGLATFGTPDSAGVPASVARDTIVLPYNDATAVADSFKQQGDKIACIIVEPVAGNMGCVPPRPGFLQALRDVADHYGSLLIFDEVISGFRVAFGGAQELYGILPDLSTLGKIIGGGLPVGAYGGPSELMNMVAPLGPVYQAGTLSGNPLAMTAGLATLRYLRTHKAKIYAQLDRFTAKLTSEVVALGKDSGVDICCNRVGSMFTWFFTAGPVTDWNAASKSDTKAFARFFRGMLENGIYLPPSQFEAAFLSAAHNEKDIQQTIAAAKQAFMLAHA